MALGVGKLVGRGMAGRLGIGAGVAGIFGLGMANTAAPAARDAAFDFAFGDPNADVAFTGRKIDTRFLAGTAMGGPLGAITRMSAPSDYMTFNAPVPTATQATAAGTIGAGIGAGVGFGIAKRFSKGRLATGVIAGVAAITGGVAASSYGLAQTRALMQQNKEFYAESPYARNSSRNITSQTNAVGDIVLGMHNSRRGY